MATIKINAPGDQSVSDGTNTYTLVRPEGPPGKDGVFDIALYERTPPDPDFQYTPAAKWIHGGSVAFGRVKR
jgi:hypothetical protein